MIPMNSAGAIRYPLRGGANVRFLAKSDARDIPVVNHRAAIRLDRTGQAEEHRKLSQLATITSKGGLDDATFAEKPLSAMEHLRTIA
jgi:hypothetical protein